MAPNNHLELLASYERAQHPPARNPSEEEAAMMYTVARNNFETVFTNNVRNITRKQYIECVFFKPKNTEDASVPVDLQLQWYFENWGTMAYEGFVAKQVDQDMKISRGIWYYGLDDQHEFSSHLFSVRCNLIAMAWMMGNDFPSDYCCRDTKEFIISFMRAWMENMTDTDSLKTSDFRRQEQFLRLWKEKDSLDLLRFDGSTKRRAERAIAKLKAQSLPPELNRKVEHTPEMRVEGEISHAEFSEFGPSLVLQRITALRDISRDIRADQTSSKKEMARRLGIVRNKSKPDSHRHIPWGSPMIQSLLNAVPQDLEHPKAIRNKHSKRDGDYRP